MINTAEKAMLLAIFAILSLSILSTSTLGIEAIIAIAGLFAVADLILEKESVK